MKYMYGSFLLFYLPFLFVACSSAPKHDPNMLADVDPITLGPVTMEFDKAFSSALNQRDVAVTFEPRINAVRLQFAYQALQYNQYWDEKSRSLFVAAVQKYHEDYDAKALIKKPSRTRGIYGKTTAMVTWKQFTFSSYAKAYPWLKIGYVFKDDKPYFSILQTEAKDVSNTDSDNSKTSLRIVMYLTRNQAEILAEYFENDYLFNLVGYSRDAGTSISDQVFDEYNSVPDEYDN
jgi:hypothetical protein